MPKNSPSDGHPARDAMPGRVVTATFPSRSAAERVGGELERLGISPDNIRFVEDAPNPASVTTDGETGWSALADSRPRDETALQRAKGIPEGPCVIGAEVDESRADSVMKLFRDLGGTGVRSSIRR